MGKRRLSGLAVAAVVFLAFLLGLFLGRNAAGPEVRVSVRPSAQTVPTPTTQDTTPAETTAPVTFPIDLNTAGERELQALPGVGQVLAERIMAYRQEHGGFTRREDLLNVEGIGQKRLEAIWDLVTVGDG